MAISNHRLITLSTLIILILIVGYGSFAQDKQIRFTKINGSNDISLGKINAITQDKNGFLWLSAQNNSSIIRYDGTKMEQISANLDELNDPKGLGGYYPECFFADENYLWIGFYGQGLDRYDMATKTFTHYDHNPDDPGSLASDYVTAVLRDQYGKLWIGTYGGLDLFDEHSETFIHHKRETGNRQSLTSDSIRVLYEDKKGTLWIGTGMPWEPNSRGGLNRYNRGTNNFTQYVHDPNDPNSLINNKVRAVFEDSRGNFWVGTGGDGLHTMDRENGKFTRHTYDPQNPNKLSRPPVNNPNQDHITFIQEDSDGNIWIGTDQNGLNIYDPLKKTITHYGNEVDNGVWWMFISGDNQIWITTNQSSLLKIDPDYTTVPLYYGQMRRKYIESDSVRWFGAEKGLIREVHKGPVSKMKYYPAPSLKQNSIVKKWNDFTDQPISLDYRVPLISTNNGDLLFISSTQFGIQQLDPGTGIVMPYTFGDSLNFGIVNQVFFSSDSIYWIGSWNQGLIKYNPKDKSFQKYINDYTNGRSLASNSIFNIQTDQDGNIWLATFNGIQRYIPSTNDFTSYLLGTVTCQLLTDSKGVMWAATQNGVFYYDPETDKFKSTKMNRTGYSIFEDLKDSGLWFASDGGVYKLDASRQYVTFFEVDVKNETAPINSNYWTLGEGYRVNNKIFIGGADREAGRYYVFNPDKLIEPKISSTPYFAALRLKQELVEPEPNGPLKTALEETKTLKLANDQNIFSFDLGTIDFKNRYDKEIYYMLDGYDIDWKSTTPNEQVAYFKIPAGKYTLRIKTPNTDGTWNEKALDIIVAPPYYLTVWAYIIYFLMLNILVFVVYRSQRARVLRKERERNKDRELAQAKEIEKAYTQLKDTQAQLIHSEKMASLGELTAGIAHEIQNPLNFVNNFSEVNFELTEELEEEIKKGNIEEVISILKDIRDNESKISQHGKRAESIIKGMLLHSRGSSGQKELTDVNALADEYLRLSYHGFRAKDKSFNADFKLVADESLPKIEVIPQDIGRVLLNLINNAFYAAPLPPEGVFKDTNYRHKPTVIVKTSFLPPSGGKRGAVVVSVSDNGPGIPSSIRDKIFQPFFTTKPTGQGTGLGLSLSYDIVKAHGGTLKVQTEEGIGTEFIIEIPII